MVVDTDWREEPLKYDYDATYFNGPSNAKAKEFFKTCHDMNVKIMFNDHPVTSAGETPYNAYKRIFDGHTDKLSDGLDLWWYDRNWTDIVESPVSGVCKEFWGLMMYYDISLRHRPEYRNVSMGMQQDGDNQ